MADSSELGELVTGIGERVRTLRLRRGMTLQALAGRTGLSLSMLSAVERGKANASLATLHAVAQSLGVKVTTLLARPGGDESPVTPLEDQLNDVMEGGALRRTAVYRPDFDIEVYVDDYEPDTAHARRQSQHPGHEFGLILKGELEIQLAGEIYTAREGDVVQYPGRLTHVMRNATDEPARAVWINLRRL